MSDLTPPEEPLDDATRARIRQRVVAGTAARPAASRRWLVPLAASVAVGALLVGAVAIGSGDDDRELAPAGPATPSVPAPESPATTSPPLPDGPTGTPGSTGPQPGQVPQPSDDDCVAETAAVLPGASEDASNASREGTSTFFVSGDRFALCHSIGATVTVHHPKPRAGGGGGRNPYEVSTDFLDGDRAVLVAGGPVPAGSPDFAVTYTFPDGSTEDATLFGNPGTGLWWLVAYLAPDATAATAGPPTVEVRGAPPAPPLDVTDTCAQVNHGC